MRVRGGLSRLPAALSAHQDLKGRCVASGASRSARVGARGFLATRAALPPLLPRHAPPRPPRRIHPPRPPPRPARRAQCRSRRVLRDTEHPEPSSGSSRPRRTRSRRLSALLLRPADAGRTRSRRRHQTPPPPVDLDLPPCPLVLNEPTVLAQDHPVAARRQMGDRHEGRSISATCNVVPHPCPSSVVKRTTACPRIGIADPSGPRYRLPARDMALHRPPAAKIPGGAAESTAPESITASTSFAPADGLPSAFSCRPCSCSSRSPHFGSWPR